LLALQFQKSNVDVLSIKILDKNWWEKCIGIAKNYFITAMFKKKKNNNLSTK